MAWCDRCDRWFASERALEQHEDNSSMHHICRPCNKDFLSEEALIQHYVQSTRHAYCQGCDEHFDSFGELYEHFDDAHYWCNLCSQVHISSLCSRSPYHDRWLTPSTLLPLQFFKNDNGLHEHRRQKHADVYCAPCKRMFQNATNLRSHERSAVHQGRDVRCPMQNCGRAFVSRSALVVHLESGACASGMTRRMIDDLVRRLDTGGVITDPARMIGYGGDGGAAVQTEVRATARAWNGREFECCLCARYRGFATLARLNQHLASPAHADKVYRCPPLLSGCSAEFATLSGLVAHVESERCGVYRFKASMDRAIDSIAVGRQIAF